LDVNTPATRGAVIQTILEVMGFPITKTLSTYSDVPTNHPYSAAIALATFAGFVTGDTAPDGALLNRFRPDDSINRAEVAKIIALVKEVMK
ncbi:MAG: S-layer homology domain-containing protein, partial [Patescibacteria group bacterium]